MNARLKNAEEIVEIPGICWVDKDTFLVPSQTYEKKYVVRNEGFRWTCTCPDSQYRKRECKHVYTTKMWLEKFPDYEPEIKEPEPEILKCPFCQSQKFLKCGSRKTTLGRKQRYQCSDCNRKFIEGIVKHIKGNADLLTKAMDLYFKGISFRSIQDHFKQFYNFEIHFATLYRWTKKYMEVMVKHTANMYPQLSPTWHADEQEIKAKGKYVYCWNLIDKETRFLIAVNVTKGRYIKEARQVFRKAKKITVGKPQFIITDGLQSYKRAIKKEFHSHRLPKLTHIGNAGVSKPVNNNAVERYHNSFRARDKTMRGFYNTKTATRFTNGYRLFYNMIRPHMALGGLTPAQVAGIDIGYSRNKWMEILKVSTDGNGYGRRYKTKRLLGYTIKIWDENGKPVKKRGMKVEFDRQEKAKEFLEFYEKFYPNLIFFVEKRYK